MIILSQQHNRHIISTQTYTAHCLQTFALFAIQPHKQKITLFMAVFKALKEALSAPVHNNIRIRNQIGKLPEKFLCVFSYFITYCNRYHCHTVLSFLLSFTVEKSYTLILFSEKSFCNMCS